MIAGTGAASAGAAALVAVIMGMVCAVEMIMVVGMGMIMAVLMLVGMAVGNTIVGMTTGNMIMIQMHSNSSVFFFNYSGKPIHCQTCRFCKKKFLVC